jgi:hypothetical protein
MIMMPDDQVDASSYPVNDDYPVDDVAQLMILSSGLCYLDDVDIQ